MNHLRHSNKTIVGALHSLGMIKKSLNPLPAVNRRVLYERSIQQPRNARHLSIFTSSASTQEKGSDHLRRVKLRAPTGRTLEIQVVHGSIADESTDAIVNPANPAIFDTISLNDASFAILDRGGEELKNATHEKLSEEQSSILPIGRAIAIKSTGALRSKYVIHAVGPIWSTENERDESVQENNTRDEQLATAILSALKLADSLSLQSISLPAISTFLNGGSRSRVSRVLFDTIINRYYMDLKMHGNQKVQLLRLVNSDEITSSCLCNEFDKREFANHPHCTHIHSVFNIPISDLPKPDESDSDRNSPYLAE